MQPDLLKERQILITGASRGLGRAIAEACVRAGASVFLCSRDNEPLEETRQYLETLATNRQKIFARPTDVSEPDEVKCLVAATLQSLPDLGGVVNCAGVYGPIGPTDQVDWEMWIRTININLLGSVLVCRNVLPHFRARGGGKIVNLSGGGGTVPLPNFSAYAASKAAIIRFTETLAQEILGSGIDVNAIAPGALNTRLLDEVITAGPENVGKAFYEKALKQKEDGGAPLEKGAELSVFLLSSRSDGITGRLLSALWDLWGDLPRHKDTLRNSDVYTLRRIVPKDRNLDWDSQ